VGMVGGVGVGGGGGGWGGGGGGGWEGGGGGEGWGWGGGGGGWGGGGGGGLGGGGVGGGGWCGVVRGGVLWWWGGGWGAERIIGGPSICEGAEPGDVLEVQIWRCLSGHHGVNVFIQPWCYGVGGSLPAAHAIHWKESHVGHRWTGIETTLRLLWNGSVVPPRRR